jgi:hypothetical protein
VSYLLVQFRPVERDDLEKLPAFFELFREKRRAIYRESGRYLSVSNWLSGNHSFVKRFMETTSHETEVFFLSVDDQEATALMTRNDGKRGDYQIGLVRSIPSMKTSHSNTRIATADFSGVMVIFYSTDLTREQLRLSDTRQAFITSIRRAGLDTGRKLNG